MLLANNLLSQKPKQRQCLLLGDTLEDTQMVTGLDFDSIYKVAFGSYHEAHFQEKFDLVLPLDGGYGPVLELFQA